MEHCGGSVTAALDAARERGVGAFLCVCISEDNKDEVLRIAQQHPDVYASVGVHPSDAMSDVVSAETLKSWADHEAVVALGETGLDYYYSADSAAVQKASFKEHLIAAGQLELPVIIHTRDAREDTLDLIREYGNAETAGVLHCFTESWDMARSAMDLNYYISISGIVTFRNAENVRDVVRKMPLDRLLIETDSPYLAPVPHRGKPNQPAYVREVAEYVADVKGLSLEELAERTTENFYRLFRRAQPPHAGRS
jgi:TatD DNase family protein